MVLFSFSPCRQLSLCVCATGPAWMQTLIVLIIHQKLTEAVFLQPHLAQSSMVDKSFFFVHIAKLSPHIISRRPNVSDVVPLWTAAQCGVKSLDSHESSSSTGVWVKAAAKVLLPHSSPKVPVDQDG